MYRVYINLHDMMLARGCSPLVRQSEAEFDPESPPIEVFTKGKTKIVVQWVFGKVRIDTITKLYTTYKDTDIHRAILISDDITTPPVAPVIPKLASQGFRIEIFRTSHLKFNPTKHRLVPQHTPLSAVEKQEVLSKYGCKETELPRINVDDPIVKYLGLEKGTLVRILRNKETTTTHVFYRIVV